VVHSRAGACPAAQPAPPPQEPPLSEFYASRRATIKDGAGYLAFVIGWFITGAAFWRVLADGFEAGDFTGAMTKFAGITILGAVLFGVLGMALGSLIGAVWETRHRRQHPVRAAALHSAGWVEPDPSAPRPFVAGKDARTLATDVLALDATRYAAAFKGTAMKRAKLAGWQRTARAALGQDA
jgi:hypothetical protein